jgi:hypothetical protein
MCVVVIVLLAGQALGMQVGPVPGGTGATKASLPIDGPFFASNKGPPPGAEAYMTLSNGWDGPGLGSANLGFYFVNYTPDLTQATQRTYIINQLAKWSAVAQVDFTEVGSAGQNQSIDIDFFSQDGPGGVLGFTYYPAPPNPEPIAGDMNFDEDELWRGGGGGPGFDLQVVGLHELGHGLGVAHSNDASAVMWPFYQEGALALTEDDINAIRTLYAARGTIPNPEAAFNITHTFRSDLEVQFGIGNPASPDHLMTLMRIYDAQYSNSDNVEAAAQDVSGALSEAALQGLLTPGTQFWLRVRDGWDLDTGTLDYFSLILDGELIEYSGAPIAIPDGFGVNSFVPGDWVYITLEVPQEVPPGEIPEPATCLLLVSAVVGGAVVRRKRSRRAA